MNQTSLNIDNDPINALRFTPDGLTGVKIYSPADHRQIGVLHWHPYYNRRVTTAARVGGKPLDLMQQIVRDYSRPGMLVADPCAGHATTLVAAKGAGRRVWGCEADADAHRAGLERLTLTPAPSLSFDAPEQTELL